MHTGNAAQALETSLPPSGAFHHAPAHDAPPTLPCLVWCVFVATSTKLTQPRAALYVFLWRYWLQVSRIHASRIPAQMIQMKSFGYGANQRHVGVSVSADVFSVHHVADDAVTERLMPARPRPALIGAALQDLQPEPFVQRRQSPFLNRASHSPALVMRRTPPPSPYGLAATINAANLQPHVSCIVQHGVT